METTVLLALVVLNGAVLFWADRRKSLPLTLAAGVNITVLTTGLLVIRALS